MSKTIPPTCPEPETGPKYWRSLDELADTPAFRQWVEREFPAGASELSDPVTRRHFMKIMSASFLLAGFGLTGCRRPEEKIVPFSKMPENYTHGMPQFFATAMPTRGSAIPLVARSDDGRPTKIEGNALHPDSNGGTDRYAQASILNLYDPDRATRFANNRTLALSVKSEAALDFLRELSKKAQTDGGQGLCFLMDRSSSPSRARLQKLLSEKLPKARWFVHEPVDFDIHRHAASVAFGKSVRPYFKFDEAKVIVSLDSDFIGAEEDAYINIRRFANGRKLETPGGSIARLYAIEALFTLTGANADHRLPLAAGAVPQAAALLGAKVSWQFAPAIQNAQLEEKAAEWISRCAEDLLKNRGESLVIAGHRQPLAVHLMAHAINVALGNIGKTVTFHEAPEAKDGSISELAQALNAGQVETLVILGGNPVYDAPVELNWAQAQRKAKTVVRLGYYEDETFDVLPEPQPVDVAVNPLTDWHLPLAHYLESWGDARTSDGTLTAVQPLIEPLFGGITELEILARMGGLEKTSPYDIVRETYFGITSGNEEDWKKFLHDGFQAGSAAQPVSVQLNAGAVARELGAMKAASLPGLESLEVIFHRDYSVDDGRFNNNGWLQELPDPVTKLTWENVVLMSRKTAQGLNLVVEDYENNNLQVPVVKIQLNGRQIKGPVWVQPGMADNVIGLALGYGRSRTGRVGNGSGYDAYALRTSDAPHIAPGAKLVSTGEMHPLSITQDHWALEGRPVVREANLEWFRQHPGFAKGMGLEKPPTSEPLYPNPLDTRKETAIHWWGMSIDLNSCVGCAACMMACQSENNVPIVGKPQVAKGREMHWIRIDRYYSGSVENPEAINQPMLCQHCEAAPCENVCPVNATVHDEEGLNVMIYNRCVGTRYCSNNCPYKVRRFNYFDYNKRPLNQLYKSPLYSEMDGEWGLAKWWHNVDKGTKAEDEWELMKLVRNPQVTVRMRGVMEKCSFCLQRIEAAKIAQKVKAGASGDIEVPDGTIKTACQQACPAEAIVFGNIKDPNSRVSQLKRQERDYKVLDFLNTKPRLTYLARVRNPNPAMPGYQEKPASFRDWESKGNELEETEESGASHDARPGEAQAEKGTL